MWPRSKNPCLELWHVHIRVTIDSNAIGNILSWSQNTVSITFLVEHAAAWNFFLNESGWYHFVVLFLFFFDDEPRSNLLWILLRKVLYCAVKNLLKYHHPSCYEWPTDCTKLQALSWLTLRISVFRCWFFYQL